MELFNSKEVSSNPINQTKMSSPIKQNLKSEDEIINFVSSESGVKPVQLDDFFPFLDSKVVQKIMDTPAESKSRILNDVAQMEYEAEGAQNILNSLG